MKLRRSFAAAVVAVTAVATVGFASPANAAVLSGNMTPPSGISGYGYYSVDTGANKLYISVDAGNMSSGNCLTVYLDIARKANVPGGSGTHYDARAVRTCQSNSFHTSSWQLEGSTYGIDITDVQKVGICYGRLNQLGTCHVYKGSLSSVNPESSSDNKCTRFWSKNSSGSTFYFNAGNVFSCQS